MFAEILQLIPYSIGKDGIIFLRNQDYRRISSLTTPIEHLIGSPSEYKASKSNGNHTYWKEICLLTSGITVYIDFIKEFRK